MLSKNYYHRSFIILQAKDTGYGASSGKDPAGYCKMEIRGNRGKMSLHVQDLKPDEAGDGMYDIFLVSVNSGISPLRLSSIDVDDRGRGECKVEFDADDVEGTGQSLDDYHAMAISKKEGQGIHYPLVGYANKRVDVDWDGLVASDLMRVYGEGRIRRQEFAEEIVEEPQEEEADNKFRDAFEDTYKDLSQEDIWQAAKDDLGEEKDASDIFNQEEYMEEEQEENEELDENEELEENEELGPEEGLKDNKQYFDDNRGYFNEKGTTYWEKTKDYYIKLFKNHKVVCPFDEDLGEVEWIRIQQINPGYSGYYPIQGYPMGYSAGSYQDHYLIGLVKEQQGVRYVIYGVPSPYSAMPPMAMIGFSRWLPVKGQYGMGYWLLYIDANTGCVVYPY